jgi:hypothetical protein
MSKNTRQRGDDVASNARNIIHALMLYRANLAIGFEMQTSKQLFGTP